MLDRRAFLKLLGLLGTAAGAPVGCRPDLLAADARGRFFTEAERATLSALCDRILPPDHEPGAAALGAVDYVERLLTAFEFAQPRIYARGPYSGRAPYPDNDTGTPGSVHPPNDFAGFLPLSPLQELAWRAEVLGETEAGLPAHLSTQRGGALRGLRSIYREGLARVDALSRAVHGHPFVSLGVAEQDAMLDRFAAPDAFAPDPVRGRSFFDLAIQHTLEGCFTAPEYGGNRGGQGFAMLGLEGDAQPLGYAIYSRASGGYHERPESPLTTANPDEISPGGALAPRPLSADGLFIQKGISELTQFLELVLPGACLPGA